MKFLRVSLVLVLLTGTAWAADPVKAKVTLRSKQQLDVELTGRESGGFVMMREAGKTAEVGVTVKDFAWVDFGVDYEKLGINAKFVAQDFAGAAQILGAQLKPLYPYLDLPSDLPKMTAELMRLLIRAGQFDDAVTTSYLISRHAKDEGLRRLAAAYRAVGLFELGRSITLDQEMKELTGVTGKDEVAGPYFYTLGRLQLIQSNYPAAHLSAAQIITYQPRDFEWMPAGLYLSAKCYIADGKLPVAEQIIAEINTAYPKSRWAALATKLDADIERRRQELKQAKPKEQP